MKEPIEQYQMCELMLGSLNGELNEDQANELGRMLREDEDARQYYSKLMMVVSSLHCPGQPEANIAPATDTVLLEVLEQQWDQQDVIEIPEPTVHSPSISYHRSSISWSGFFRIAGSIAAMIIIAFMLNSLTKMDFSSRQQNRSLPTNPIVARIVASSNCQWQRFADLESIDSSMPSGIYQLDTGLVHLGFLDGADVIIEAPAKFQLESDSRLSLFVGKLSARVPRGSEGFKVITPSADYVDVGTEFGIKVDTDGYSQMHVFDGEVLMFTDQNANEDRKGISVPAGQTKGVDKITGQIKDFERSEVYYARDLPGKYENMVRKSKPDAYWNFDCADQNYIVNMIGDDTYVGQMYEQSRIEKISQDYSALRFSSAKDNIMFGDVLDPGKESYTVSIWFKVDSIDSNLDQVLATKRSTEYYKEENDIGYPGWTIFTNRDSMFIRTGDGAERRSHVWIKKLHCLSVGWHQVVMVIDRNENILRGYFDGDDQGWAVHSDDGFSPERKTRVAYDTYRPDTSIENDFSLCINADIDKSGAERRTFYGYMYDMGIWKRALSSKEIMRLYSECPLKMSK
ncbi:MAG: FecR domain-containing protein [Phycisphaerae bacterium]|nr:FecR domain-containing protein [Phycisphaerae bacterium]